MKQNQQRPGVMMYFHLLEPMRSLSPVQFAEMIWALMDYAQYGVLPEFSDPLMTMSWGYLRHAADVDLERYEERCRNAKAAIEKRWGKRDTNGYDRIPPFTKDTKYNTETDSDTQADADANTTASASANTDTNTEADADPQTETGADLPGVPPPVLMEPLETPRAMANSPSWQKMVQASRYRREDAAHEAWREAQIAEFTRQNEALRAAARAKNIAAG